MSDTSSTSSGGIEIAGALGVAFVVLKLCRVIDWSWPWVLAPFWIPLAIVGVFLVIALLCHLISKILP